MSNHPIRVSIVVPTKDRYETLFECVRALLINYESDVFEIVVRDNSAQPRAAEFLTEFGAHRNIVYRTDPTPVSQSENCELAVAIATGEFVTLIGDDDGISFGLLQIADWMARHGIDAFFSGSSVYRWPGVTSRIDGANDTGWLSLLPASRGRDVDPQAQRKAVLACGSASLEQLPRLYHGLVRRTCLDRLRAQAGTCFPGPSPDMANAFALSFVVSKLFVAELPIFISGNSRKSAAGIGLRGKHVGEIPNQPFLPRDTTEKWNAGIPYFWSGQTIWSQSAFVAAASMGRAAEFESANNYRQLYARVLVFHPRFVPRVLRALRARRFDVCRQVFELAAISTIAVAMLFSRISGIARRRLRVRSDTKGAPIKGLCTVMDATRHVDRVMHGLNLETWLERSMKDADR